MYTSDLRNAVNHAKFELDWTGIQGFCFLNFECTQVSDATRGQIYGVIRTGKAQLSSIIVQSLIFIYSVQQNRNLPLTEATIDYYIFFMLVKWNCFMQSLNILLVSEKKKENGKLFATHGHWSLHIPTFSFRAYQKLQQNKQTYYNAHMLEVSVAL